MLWHWADGFALLRRKVCCWLVSPLAGYEPANLVSTVKHANHYTTEDDLQMYTYWSCSSTPNPTFLYAIYCSNDAGSVSETSVNLYQIIRCNIKEESIPSSFMCIWRHCMSSGCEYKVVLRTWTWMRTVNTRQKWTSNSWTGLGATTSP
jgi:hypothetical protein